MTQLTINDLFDHPITYPDVGAQERLDNLVGLDEHKARLAKILGLLINPAGLKSWASRYHSGADKLLDAVLRRPPLVVLAGDVGSGKSELAETIGDYVARQEKVGITLYPMSLAIRGQGRVGQMTELLSAAFDCVLEQAQKLKGADGASRGAVILLVDEADAIAQSREASQMHHEDRAGVNAFIRGIDRLANAKLPVAAIMCTNRLGALDPAIQRRAADILSFARPDDKQRTTILSSLSHLGLSETQIATIVKATGARQDVGYGFTFSDLTQRLLPAIVLDAYPDSAVDPDRAILVAKAMIPTEPFHEVHDR